MKRYYLINRENFIDGLWHYTKAFNQRYLINSIKADGLYVSL